MLNRVVLVGYVNDEFGEFWIYREYSGQIKLPKNKTDKFTGNNITKIPKKQVLMGSFIVNHKKYTIIKERKMESVKNETNLCRFINNKWYCR